MRSLELSLQAQSVVLQEQVPSMQLLPVQHCESSRHVLQPVAPQGLQVSLSQIPVVQSLFTEQDASLLVQTLPSQANPVQQVVFSPQASPEPTQGSAQILFVHTNPIAHVSLDWQLQF